MTTPVACSISQRVQCPFNSAAQGASKARMSLSPIVDMSGVFCAANYVDSNGRGKGIAVWEKLANPSVISVDGMIVEVGRVSKLAHVEMYLGPTVSPDCALELKRI